MPQSFCITRTSWHYAPSPDCNVASWSWKWTPLAQDLMTEAQAPVSRGVKSFHQLSTVSCDWPEWLSETYRTVIGKSRMASVGCRGIQSYELSHSFPVNYRSILSRKSILGNQYLLRWDQSGMSLVIDELITYSKLESQSWNPKYV